MRHRKGTKIHKTSTKTRGSRKTTIHGGFKAMEHKKGGRKAGRRKRA